MLDLNHKRLNVWILSVELTCQVYQLTEGFPDHEKYGLTSQLRRSALSVTSNISEGASRSSIKERARFFEISRSSLVELDTHIEISIRLGYVTSELLNNMKETTNHLFASLSRLIGSMKKSDLSD